MLTFKDATAAIDEPRNARMEQRTKPHVKETIQQAAALLGVDETALVTTAAYERARAVIAEHYSLKLTVADAEALFAAIDNPTPRTEAELEGEQLHHRLVRNRG